MAEKDKQKEGEGLVPVATMTRNVVESYIFATGHQDLSIYSERLLMQLVKAAQCQLNGISFRDGSGIRQVSIGKLGDAVVEIEARELLNGSNNTNYTQAKKAVLELMKKHIEHERPVMKNGRPLLNEEGDQIYQYEAHNLLNDVYINKKPGTIIVNVNKTTWEAILDFSKGFRRYDLQVAMRFSRTCSLRLFKLVSNQQYPLTYTIDELREQWGLKDKYKKTKDFIKNTIESAKEELDRTSPWTFDYQPVYAASSLLNKGRAGRKAITSITFYPKHQLRYESTSTVAAPLSPSDMLGRPVVERLVKNLRFSMAEIKANMVLFNTARKYFELEDFLIEITPRAGRAPNPKGYVINAVKNRLKERHGVVIRKNEILAEKQPESRRQESSAAAQPGRDASIQEILKSGKTLNRSNDDKGRSEKTIGSIIGNLFDED